MAGRSRARIEIRRVYDPPADDNPYRVLVDRLWPRGITKADAAIDEWAKEVAPSTGLRRWYGHDPDKFPEFASRYRTELNRLPAVERVQQLRRMARRARVELVTATRDVEHSGASVLLDVLAERTHRGPARNS